MPSQANFRGKERKEGLDRVIPCAVIEAWFCKIIPIKVTRQLKLSLLMIVWNPVFKFPYLERTDIPKILVIAFCLEINPQNPADELIHEQYKILSSCTL